MNKLVQGQDAYAALQSVAERAHGLSSLSGGVDVDLDNDVDVCINLIIYIIFKIIQNMKNEEQIEKIHQSN